MHEYLKSTIFPNYFDDVLFYLLQMIILVFLFTAIFIVSGKNLSHNHVTDSELSTHLTHDYKELKFHNYYHPQNVYEKIIREILEKGRMMWYYNIGTKQEKNIKKFVEANNTNDRNFINKIDYSQLMAVNNNDSRAKRKKVKGILN